MIRRCLALLASLVPLLLLAPVPAHACGGTFCDNLPQPMPVDQTGEDILFVLDGSTVEVHIRIEYTGEAERFAWVVPLQGIPEVSVGSEPLFDALSNAVAPNWRRTTQYDCPWERPSDSGLGFVPFSDFGSVPEEPEVVYSATVGAFDVVVLQGGTAAEVIDFLQANDYAQDPQSEPILQEYLDDGFLFAAVKLTSQSEVNAIHPLVFRFPGNEPCVPIRLTRIAAEDDMGIRVYFLGQERWAPSNYLHVELNPLAYDWEEPFADVAYRELLSMAVDEAGGRAFATEYVGPPDVVETVFIYSESWDETEFVGLNPVMAIDLLTEQGLNFHPLIQSLLLEFIPPPDHLDPQQFWNNLENYADFVDLSAWDSVAFAAALSERIIEPGLHADDLLATWPKLTRLDTMMSPHEMTVDPVFHTNASLPDVDHTRVTTLEQVQCGGDRLYHVDVEGEDKPVCVPESDDYPDWVDMPRSLWSGQVPMVGGPQVVNDNRAAIEGIYQAYQSNVQCGPDGGDGDGDPGDGDPGDGDPGGDPSSGGDGTSTGEPGIELPYSVGCGCSTDRGAAPLGVALGVLVLGLLGPWRRRD